MPRIPRKYLGTDYFHIITQGIEKKYIFDNPEDIKYYIKLMYELKKDCNIDIISYCIMNNHAHILIKSENVNNLSKYMQRLNMKYGYYYNKKNDRVGYVFRDRYKSEGIYSDEHLYNCMNYIYNNPVKAGICISPKDYPYSNYKEIGLKTIRDYSFIDVNDYKDDYKNEILEFLSKNNIQLENIKNDKLKLEIIIKTFKNKYKISLRKIAQELNINRETIREIYNKKTVNKNRPH